MFNKEELVKKSEKDLEEVYSNLKDDYNSKLSKNLRIQNILNQKIEEKNEKIINLENEIKKLLNDYPDLAVVKSGFDDKNYDPFKLREEISEIQKNLSALHTHKIKTEESIINLENIIMIQNSKKEQLQDEIEKIIKDDKDLSIDNTTQQELKELEEVTKESQTLQDELTKINDKIMEISILIHNKDD